MRLISKILVVVATIIVTVVVWFWRHQEESISVSTIIVAASPKTTISSVVTNFDEWSVHYFEAATSGEKTSLEKEGIAWACARREELKKLIQTDPQQALARAMPWETRQQLPAAVVAQLERPISGRGDFAVRVASNFETGVATVQRQVTLHGEKFEAFVYGQREALKTRRGVAFHGIAVDDKLAVAEDPVRVLPPAEAASILAANPAAANQPCPISGAPASSSGQTTLVDVGGQILYLCHGGHIEAVRAQAIAQDGGSANGVQGAASLSDPWTTGAKNVLIIPVRFADQPSAPDTTVNLSNMMVNVNLFYITNSLQQTSMNPTIAPCYLMPHTTAWYVTNDDSFADTVLNDARAVAANPSNYPGNEALPAYNYLNYDLEAVRYNSGPGNFSGQAFVGGRGCWLKSSSYGVPVHEFGHNYGNWHANRWDATGDSIVGAGTHVEYGNIFDTMGTASGSPQFFNANLMRDIDWLSDSNLWVLNTASTNGVFRITRLDHGGTYDLATKYAIRIPSPVYQRDYWIDFRQKQTGNRWTLNGAIVKWGDLPASNGGSRLLDTTPGTADDVNDSPVIIGRTYADTARNIFITPIQKGGTVPETLDVAINIGPFPSNQAPTNTVTASVTTTGINSSLSFTAAAADPDGDALAYNWDFGDRNFGSNVTHVTHSWTLAGTYVVRCTASDMKGGTDSEMILVTIGAPETFTVQGTVLDDSGNPVADVRISNGLPISDASYRNTYSDIHGHYILPNLPLGNYTITAVLPGKTIPSRFTNPVFVGPSRTGMDFGASAPQVYTINGNVADGGIGMAGVLVSDGTRTDTTDTNGNFSISSVPNGTYTLTATKPGCTILPLNFSNPVIVNFTGLVSQNFSRSQAFYYLNGMISGVDTSKVLTVTDGHRTASVFSQQGSGGIQGQGYLLYNVPAGQWTVRAYNATQSFSPANFSNPLAVNVSMTNVNFAVDGTRQLGISGQITDLGQGLSNVLVTISSQTTTTDAQGGFYLGGLTNGSYNVAPSLAGYAFSPLSRLVTLSNSNVFNQNFATTNVDASPVIVNLASATPNPVTNTTASLSVLANDNNGEQFLIYTWATVGTPPAAVIFTPNTNNAAKNATATFAKIGNYGLRVIARDLNGGTATSTVNVTVSPTLASLAVSPGSTNLTYGAAVAFSASGKDQFGVSLTSQPPATWSVVGGGSIDVGGIYTATNTLGYSLAMALSGGQTGTATIVVNAPPGPGFGITREWYTNIAGSTIATLTNSAKFIAGQPDAVTVVSNLFEGPVNVADNYGTRMRGYFVAPVTGSNYVFWIAGDDTAELYFSATTNPANKVKIASVPSGTLSRAWLSFNTQQAAGLSLVGGQLYYIEALHKENNGSDNLAVGVDLPGDIQERPIPAHRLLPWGALPPTVTLTSPTNGAAFAAPATIVINATASDSDGSITNIVIQSNGLNIGGTNASSNSLTWTNVGGGNYNLTAIAWDNSGNSSTSAAVSLTVTQSLPTVTVAATLPNAAEAGPVSGAFTISRTGATSGSLTVQYILGGTAINGADYSNLTTSATIQGGSANAIINVIPIPDTIAEGTETVTLTLVSQSPYVVGTSSNATVNIADLPIDDWRFQKFGVNANNPAIAGDLADPNGNGWPNLLEYAFNLNPFANSNSVPVQLVATNNHLTLIYTRRKAPTDVIYAVEGASMIGAWSTSGIVELQSVDDGNGLTESVTAQDTSLMSTSTVRFLHIRVTRP